MNKHSTHKQEIPGYLGDPAPPTPRQWDDGTMGGGPNRSYNLGAVATGTTGTPAPPPAAASQANVSGSSWEWGVLEYALMAVIAYFLLRPMIRQ